MGKMKVFDEHVVCVVERGKTIAHVAFCDIKAGDIIRYGNNRIEATEDARQCEDPDYEGWLFWGRNWDVYFPYGGRLDCGFVTDAFFPEDFGAEESGDINA